jgi:membrane-associated phospholipid phosphatase
VTRIAPARKSVLALFASLALAAGAFAQQLGGSSETENEKVMTEAANSRSTGANTPSSIHPPVQAPAKRSSQFLRDFLNDQKDLWAAPKELRFQDASWLVPLSGLSAGLFVTDADFSRHLSHDPHTLSHYNTLSNAGVAALVGGAGGMWLLSHWNHNDHWRETGFLAGEAAVHSLVMTEALKYSFRRDRPYQGDGTGSFFQSGGTSFPSGHSAIAWSVAGVLAHEYPGPLTKILAYGAASAVSFSRIKAEKHFPSDVFVSALLGQLVAHQIYTKHHDPELGGDTWTSPANLFYDEGHSRPGYIGSPYVPLDSWIYPALDRLAAMGLIDSAFAGMRPWTRLACAQMFVEAQDRADAAGPVALDLVNALQKEFQPELGGGADRGRTIARLESLYFRLENISGPPLTDGYHFGQTQINDFGRPYSQGWNSVTGFSAFTTSGPWSAYVRGELQTSPGIPALPLPARQFIAQADFLPSVAPATGTPAVQQARFLDAYVGLTFSNWEVSFGRQSLSWGPGEGGALMFSDNAAPIDMFRVSRVTPWGIPLLSRILGPMRAEFFFGQLTGQHFVNGVVNNGVFGSYSEPLDPQPFIHGQRFSFKPTPNFEFGFSRTTIFAGPGIPLTWSTFKTSLLGTGNAAPGTPKDPGDRRSGLDWSYRLPKLRNWLTFYGDAFADDQFSPIAYWDRSAIRAGLFLSHVPGIPRLDLRAEGVYTDVPAGGALSRGFFYFNVRFLNGYTNGGALLGSWIGRQSQGAQASSNYWFNARDRLRFSFRHQKISQQFVPGGGTLTDFGVQSEWQLRDNLTVSAGAQYERWLIPLLQPGPQQNLSTTLSIRFEPAKWFPGASHE